jgi:uncharacterized membrane protein YqaE (UPF0057 family)
MAAATFCEILIAILLPPLGVFLRYSCAVSTLLIRCMSLTIYAHLLTYIATYERDK